MKILKVTALCALFAVLAALVGFRAGVSSAEPEAVEIEKIVTVEVEKPVEVVKEIRMDYVPTEAVNTELTPDMVSELPLFDRACAMMAQLSYLEQTYAPKWFCEKHGTNGTELIAAVDWCVCNRCDSKDLNELISNITAPFQFAYCSTTAIDAKHYAIAQDVITRWLVGDLLIADGRVLPEEYEWFGANGDETNAFRDAYTGGNRWDWSLTSPY